MSEARTKKTPLASHPQNPIQKKRQGLVIGTTKKSLLCSKTRSGTNFRIFCWMTFEFIPKLAPPLSMSDDMWSLVRAVGRVYIRTDTQQRPASVVEEQNLTLKYFQEKVQCPENCFRLPCYFWLMCPLQVCFKIIVFENYTFFNVYFDMYINTCLEYV